MKIVIFLIIALFFLGGDSKSNSFHPRKVFKEPIKQMIRKPIDRPIIKPIPKKRLTTEEVVQKIFPSVVFLMMKDENDQPVSLGSGFFVKDDIVATNLNILKGASKGYAKIMGEEKRYNILGTVGTDTNMNLALLSIARASGPYLRLGSSGQVQMGDEIIAAGNPYGFEGTFYKGIVSGIRQIRSKTIFQITSPIPPGINGGPVMNIRGEVIGVAASILHSSRKIYLAIPAYYLASLLSKITTIKPLSEKKILEKSESIIDLLGKGAIEGVEGYLFKWYPAHYYLHEFGQLRASYKERYFSFSLRNRLDEPVKNVVCWVIFYTHKGGKPIDYSVVQYPGIIPPGLAKRVKGSVSSSVMNAVPHKWDKGKWDKTWPKVEIRVVNFEIAGQDHSNKSSP